jgi:hypothetical protein
MTNPPPLKIPISPDNGSLAIRLSALSSSGSPLSFAVGTAWIRWSCDGVRLAGTDRSGRSRGPAADDGHVIHVSA